MKPPAIASGAQPIVDFYTGLLGLRLVRLFGSASDPPGVAVDEPAVALGDRPQLPPWLEGLLSPLRVGPPAGVLTPPAVPAGAGSL
jgi:catechol 2,3-dioxygenase-like lactoylglutathione lyase family enzyme